MTDDVFKVWLDWHCRFLCRNNAEYRGMLEAWRSEFEGLAATKDELEAATRNMAKEWLPANSTASWAAYPGVMLGWIRQKRKKQEAEAEMLRMREESKRAKERAKIDAASPRQDWIASLLDPIGKFGKLPKEEE